MRADAGTFVELVLDEPEAGSVLRAADGQVIVSGSASAYSVRADSDTAYDLMFVIDRSKSTNRPAGFDVDGDGIVGVPGWFRDNTDPGDTILAAQIALLASVLGELDPERSRVGVVAFDGDADPLTPNAETILPLTSDLDAVRSALAALRESGARGRTDLQAGIRVASDELARGSDGSGSERVMVVVSDGRPTLPLESSNTQNARLAVAAAARAASDGIRIETFSTDPEADSALAKVSAVARGKHRALTTPPWDLAKARGDLDLGRTQLEIRLRVRNLTNGDTPRFVYDASRRFEALVKLEPGPNTLEVIALAPDATGKRAEFSVMLDPDAKGSPGPGEADRRARLEERLERADRVERIADDVVRAILDRLQPIELESDVE